MSDEIKISTREVYTYGGQDYLSLREAERARAWRRLGAFMDESGVGSGGEWDKRMIREHLVDNAAKYVELLTPLAAPLGP